MWRLAVLVSLVAFATQTAAQCDGGVGFASYYASHMVLQQAPARPRLWGYAANVGDLVVVTVTPNGQTLFVNAVLGPEGRPVWEILLQPIPVGAPQTIHLQVGDGCEVTLTDVLIGDVWICSGQSNMQHSLDSIDDPQGELDDTVNFPNVRTFFAQLEWDDQPQYDLKNIVRNWALPNAGNMGYFSAICWLFGRNLYRKHGIPVGMIETNWGGTRVEAWSSPEALQNCFDNVDYNDPPNGASQLYNAMIHPFLPMPIYGGIWYQGESNAWASYVYGCAIKSMVNDWRASWHARNPEMNAAFPFGQVQLAPWRNEDIADGFPDLRWSQTDSFGYCPNQNMNNHFIACAIDLPDFNSPFGDIHPRYKRQIADRLALGAFAVAYGEQDSGLYQGPIPTAFALQGGNVHITYSVPIAPLRTVQPQNFEICCGAAGGNTCLNGGYWAWTQPVAADGMSVTVANTCNEAEEVTGFRYLWRESPCALEDCPVYSVENDLPAPPYVHHGAI